MFYLLLIPWAVNFLDVFPIKNFISAFIFLIFVLWEGNEVLSVENMNTERRFLLLLSALRVVLASDVTTQR